MGRQHKNNEVDNRASQNISSSSSNISYVSGESLFNSDPYQANIDNTLKRFSLSSNIPQNVSNSTDLAIEMDSIKSARSSISCDGGNDDDTNNNTINDYNNLYDDGSYIQNDTQNGSDDSSSLFPTMNNLIKGKKEHKASSNNRQNSHYEDSVNNLSLKNSNSIDSDPFNKRISTGSYRHSIDNNNDNDDIRSSVLHQILDNESFSNELNRDKIFYNKLYNKYDKKNNKRKQKNEVEITDFQQYNKLLQREENLKHRLNSIAKRKGKILSKDKNNRNNNVLMTLDESELNNLFGNLENPKNWNEKNLNIVNTHSHSNLNSTQNSKQKTVLKHFLKALHSRESTHSASNEKKDPYIDYVSTFSSIPIDDDVEIEDLPIDSQPLNLKKQKDFVNEFNIDRGFSSNDIDIVVSGQEKVDYNFHKIDDYQNFDPIENPQPKTKFMKFLNSINPLRIIRIQSANKYQIQRKLNVRHLHQIALGGTLGVGLLLSSGKAFTIAGPLGCLLGFIVAGFIVISTMLSFCEIVTLIPLCGGVSGIASRFVDDAFGFALGVVYWVTYMISLPTEITAAAIMLSFYSNLDVPGPKTAGWITLFFFFTLLLNLFDIRVYGEFEYYSTIIKLLILIGLMVYMIVLNTGGSPPLHEKIGFKYWNSKLSDVSEHITFGPFRPTFDVTDLGLGALNGIGGNTGRFLQILIASVIASYAYVGTEIVILAGGESTNPRHSIPSATKNIFYRIVIFYLVAIFLIGLNIYSGDPRLLRYFSSENQKLTEADIKLQNEIINKIGGNHCNSEMVTWAGFSNGNQSPFVIAIQSASLCSFASAVNAFLLYFALTAASSQLYASSRTLYFMSVQNKAPKIFSLCTKKGVPYMSVLFTGSFGLLSYLSVQNNTALIFERMVSVCATGGLLVWSGMCLSFIRFYYALKLRPDIINRNDDDYPYRSPLQPYLAYSGLILGMFLVLASGFIVFLKGQWSSLFFISSYGCLFLFIACYFGFKIIKRTKIERLDQVDLDSGRREIDRVIWEDEKNYSNNFREILVKGINLFI